jgi:GTP diphosphokinase / guanosine-3',5'-bis(diphosphate) 3'-diphosphatase
MPAQGLNKKGLDKNTELLDIVISYQPNCNLEILNKAYQFAEAVHRGQVRETGEPYFTHLVETALLAANLKLDDQAVVAALLHDTIEDCNVTENDIAEEFGEEIATIVDGVTKLTKIEHESRSYRQAENLRKMLLAAGKDIRVILIKLCDRLHNMRTMEICSREKQKRKALETKDFYATIAHRLGIYPLQAELEDLSFKYIEPESYQCVIDTQKKYAKERLKFGRRIISELHKTLQDNEINCVIRAWYKNSYHIWQESINHAVPIEQIDNVISFLIIVPTTKICYDALCIIHSQMRPIPSEFVDYIARPRSNMYQSLHTTVWSSRGERIELRIRTNEMNEIANRGVIATYNNKNSLNNVNFDWMSNFLGSNDKLEDHEEFLDSIRVELFPEEIVTLTPKGDPVILPYSSTPLDFAYSLDPALGHRTIAAVVNGKQVPLRYCLENGDTVELVTSAYSHPVPEWLNHVTLTKAKREIRGYLRNEERRKFTAIGKEVIATTLANNNFNPTELENNQKIYEAAVKAGLSTISSLYEMVGRGVLRSDDIIEIIINGLSTTEQLKSEQDLDKNDNSDSVNDTNFLIPTKPYAIIKTATCCNPIYGEPIIGINEDRSTVIVHSQKCPFTKISELMLAYWRENNRKIFSVKIKIDTKDRVGMLKNVVECVSKKDISINQAVVYTIPTKKLGIFELELHVKKYQDFEEMISCLNLVDGIIKIERIFQ